MSQHTVGIFPASGGIGGGTVKHILNRLPAKDLIFIARSPEKLAAEKAAGATIRKADTEALHPHQDPRPHNAEPHLGQSHVPVQRTRGLSNSMAPCALW